MQKTQNADIQRVMNLVDFYRTKVGKESDIAKAAKADYDFWEKENQKMAMEAFDAGESCFLGHYGEGTQTKIWVEKLQVNEQLLGHFYMKVAGKDADKNVLSLMLPDIYDETIFTQEEEGFLMSHFKEMVNYILQTPNNDLEYVHRYDDKDKFRIPDEVLQLIANRVIIEDGATVYNPFAGFAQFATLYRNCKFYCEDSYGVFRKKWNDFCDTEGLAEKIENNSQMHAWMTIVLYANGVDGIIIEDGEIPVSFDALLAYIPLIPKSEADEASVKVSNNDELSIVSRIRSSYQNLKKGGTMALLIPCGQLYDNKDRSTLFKVFMDAVIKEKSITEIIQLPDVMNVQEDFCLVVIKKGVQAENIRLLDIRFAGKKSNVKGTQEFLCIADVSAMIKNDGKDCKTGLRKLCSIPCNELRRDVLLPQVYVVETPSCDECPAPLSQLCTLVSSRISELQFDLPEDTPWVHMNNLTSLFTGELDLSTMEKAGCPNNPKYVEGSKEYAFSDSGKFIDSVWAQAHMGKTRGCRVAEYRRCIYLDGKSDAVLNRGKGVALVRATGKPIAIDPWINVFVPNKNLDALSLVALLQMPIVYRQIQAYKEFGLENYLDDILVPINKRVVMDEVKRIEVEREAYKAQQERFENMKSEYVNEVRMRKHDMGQYVFELINIEDLMRYYMENKDKEKDFCQRIEELLDNFKASIGELSTLLDNLSKEEEFGEPERFDLHEFLSHLEGRHKTEGYVIKYECDMESIIDYNLQKKDEIDDYLLEQEEVDARAQQEIDDYLLEQQEEDARAQQEIDDYLLEQQEEDARVQQEIEDSLLEDEAYVFDETQTSDDESYVADETSNVDDSAYVFEESQTHDDEPYFVDEKQIVDDEPYVIDGFWGKYLSTIPSLYVAPNDIQRLVNNILDNARKHGFTDHKRGDYEVDVKLSINTETKMFQIDFRNNGNPLPDGMDKMRYGIKGEKAGSTGGTGIGGSYVKKCVEHYGGNYDIFMEDGWTVIRICLPIK